MAKGKYLLPQPKGPRVGLAVMARDAERTLPLLLQSVRPYVHFIAIGVDELTTDRTAQVAKKCGADEVFPLHVSDEHECVIHGRKLAQHFGNARQETYRHLPVKDLDFTLWLDADDILEGGEKIASTLAALPEETVGLWLPYHYGWMEREDGQRVVNTLFHRERFLRTKMFGKPVTTTWEGRVHETVKPNPMGPMAVTDDIVVVHQQNAHKTDESAPRNTLLLEMDFEEDPHSTRTLFYLGCSHFALGNWAEAIRWFELRCAEGDEGAGYELWNTYHYLALAYLQMGDLTSAQQAACQEALTIPHHPEPYFLLAKIEALAGRYEQSLEWNKIGRTKKPAPFWAFKNPMESSYHQRMVQGGALLNLGRVTEAKNEWMEAGKIMMNEEVAGAIQDAAKKEADVRAADAFVEIVTSPGFLKGKEKHGESEVTDYVRIDRIYRDLSDDVKSHGRVRDLLMPLKREIHRAAAHQDSQRIVFWCGNPVEPWAPPSLNTTGIGGSETAVIEISKRFARAGWTVDVYNGADRYEGVYEGVGYWDLRRFGTDEKADVFVSWRNPAAHGLPIEAKTKVLWCHDLHYGPDEPGHFFCWDKVLGVSQWHADMLRHYYGPRDPINPPTAWDRALDYVPNGIDLSRFQNLPEKVPYRCVYASSPDRGLDRLLHIWPQILATEPQAELHIAYGWDTIDKMILNGRDDLAAFKDAMVQMIASTPRVVYRGRLPQDELAKLYGESVAWLYPTQFLEVSCISAMEAMAGGAIPVVTAAGALPETIGDAGFLVPGPTTSRGFQDTFPTAALGVLLEKNVRTMYAEQARRRATGLSWDAAFARWLSVLGLRDPYEQIDAEDLVEQADLAELVMA